MGGKEAHDGWLNQRNQGHVRIGSNGDWTYQILYKNWIAIGRRTNDINPVRQSGRKEYGGRSIGSPDNPNGSCLLRVESRASAPRKVRKIPTWAAAPSNINLGLLIREEKRSLSPIPQKNKGGIDSL